jgi:hypothetical protein
MNTKKPTTEPLDAASAAEKFAFLEGVISNFSGQINELESALGMYMVARFFGWKVLHIVHSKHTIKKYEDILGISLREEFDDLGLDAHRSLSYTVIQSLSNFWKSISGKLEIENRRFILPSQ